MASLDSTTSKPTTRTNPRRRQRPEEGGSLPRQPHRKRSKLSEEDPQINGWLNGLPQDPAALNEGSIFDMPMRGKRAGRGGSRNDGSVVLTENPNYCLKQLPSLPHQLRNGEEYRAFPSSWTHQMLAITQQQALVWDSSSASAVPTTRVFDLPNPSTSSDTISLGSLVNTGNAAETGLVAIHPISGKVTFWENVENADSLRLFEQKRNGVAGAIKGMYMTERVTGLHDAEGAGFLLSFSTGRVAQLLVRDSQGMPAISTQFLYRPTERVGIFGSIRNALSSGMSLKNCIAMRTHHSNTRGVLEAAMGSDEGTFQFWRLGWGRQPTFLSETSAKDQMHSAIGQHFQFKHDAPFEVKLADFEITDVENTSDDDQEPNYHLHALLSVTSPGLSCAVCAELLLQHQTLTMGRILTIDCDITALNGSTKWKPQIFVLHKQTVLVVLGKALSLLSIAPTRPTMDPDTQLHPFQDTVYFKDGDEIAIVGVCPDNQDAKHKASTATIYMRTAGAIKLIVDESSQANEAVVRHPVTAKNKIEQAVFRGKNPANPIDFSRLSAEGFEANDISHAARLISKEILTDRSDYTPSETIPVADHLQARASSLKDLAHHLKFAYSELPKEVKWELICDAERLAAAQVIWSQYERNMQINPDGTYLLPEIISGIRKRYPATFDKQEPSAADHVRLFFLRNIHQVHAVFILLDKTLQRLTEKGHTRSIDEQISLLRESYHTAIDGLKAAWTFRHDNLWLYNLEKEDLEQGMLRSEKAFSGLDKFWTGDEEISKSLKDLILDATPILNIYTDETAQTPSEVALHVSLVQVCCKSFEEHMRWLKGNQDVNAAKEQQTYLKSRYQILETIGTLGVPSSGFLIAEQYGDVRSLMKLFSEEATFWSEIREESVKLARARNGRDDSDVERESRARIKEAETSLKALETRNRDYFDRFGMEWAKTRFDGMIDSENYGDLLDQSQQDYQAEYVTKYLRAHGSRRKLAWIDDVMTLQDYNHAGELLDKVAQDESSLWCKRTELALSKLALAAAEELQQGPTTLDLSDQQKAESALVLMKIQDQIYDHIAPAVQDAVDQDAAVANLMESHGSVNVHDRPALRYLLQAGFDALLSGEETDPIQLIDILTLMDRVPCPSALHDISRKEFYMALQVLQNSRLETESPRYQLILRTIWRRAYLADPWKAVNSTKGKSDTAVSAQLSGTALYNILFLGEKASLFSGTRAVSVIDPETALGAGSKPADQALRFGDSSLRDRIARENATEDKRLSEAIQKFRLVHWFEAAKAEAARGIANAAEEKRRWDEKVSTRIAELVTVERDYGAMVEQGEDGVNEVTEDVQVVQDLNGDVVAAESTVAVNGHADPDTDMVDAMLDDDVDSVEETNGSPVLV